MFCHAVRADGSKSLNAHCLDDLLFTVFVLLQTDLTLMPWNDETHRFTHYWLSNLSFLVLNSSQYLKWKCDVSKPVLIAANLIYPSDQNTRTTSCLSCTISLLSTTRSRHELWYEKATLHKRWVAQVSTLKSGPSIVPNRHRYQPILTISCIS